MWSRGPLNPPQPKKKLVFNGLQAPEKSSDEPPTANRPSPILAAIDRMIAAPAPENKPAHQEAPAGLPPTLPDSVARTGLAQLDTSRSLVGKPPDPFDQTVERVRDIFKGELIP